jgi:hypothetical protein
MNTGKRIALAIIAVVTVAICVALLAKSEPEPEFGGQPLSYWIFQASAHAPRRNPEAIRALRTMGEPAVQRLTRIVEREDSALRLFIAKHGDKVPMLNENLPAKYWFRIFAAQALGAIGTNAASAIPALEKMAADNDRMLASAARTTLVLIKGEAIDSIIATYLNYADRTNSSNAYGTLLSLGPYAEEAIPTLLVELESTNQIIQLKAMTLLENVGAESEHCVSVMTNLLSDPDYSMRYSAAQALANSGPLAKHATPLVVRLLDDPKAICRSSALMFLYSVVETNEFAPYQTAVQRMTNDPEESVRDAARFVLEKKADRQ